MFYYRNAYTTPGIKQPNIIYALLKKQRRDPTLAPAADGAAYAPEQKSPAREPSFAKPPKRTPRRPWDVLAFV